MARGVEPHQEAEYICADQIVILRFRLQLRRTIHTDISEYQGVRTAGWCAAGARSQASIRSRL